MKQHVKLFFVVAMFNVSACAHTEQSSRAAAGASELEEDSRRNVELHDKILREIESGEPPEEKLDAETIRSFRRVRTQPAGR